MDELMWDNLIALRDSVEITEQIDTFQIFP
jgi:hypothetical protein